MWPFKTIKRACEKGSILEEVCQTIKELTGKELLVWEDSIDIECGGESCFDAVLPSGMFKVRFCPGPYFYVIRILRTQDTDQFKEIVSDVTLNHGFGADLCRNIRDQIFREIRIRNKEDLEKVRDEIVSMKE